jgi:hypothetical protein
METENETEADDGMRPIIVGHILIRDVDTGEVLVRQRDNFVQQDSLDKDNA